jgi:5-methyltetrahydropteroyltriglutamate--homocysteine methyltransferase
VSGQHPRLQTGALGEIVKRSAERVLTTHAGSLPRPPAVLDLVEGRDQRVVQTNAAAGAVIDQAVREAVARQVGAGIDIPSDGEMGRVGFSSYATERLSGFDGTPRAMPPQVERSLFPEFYAEVGGPASGLQFPACNGPIAWRGPHGIQREIATFKAALQGVSPAEAFMPAVSPGQLWINFANEYYPSDEAFIFAAADALANEYRAVVDAGFVLQLDDPGLAMGWNRAEFTGRSIEEYRRVVAQHIAAINHALRGIPADRVRLHVCWGNAEWPHVRDVPLAEIVDLLFEVNAEGLSVEGSNPRHGHEWRVFPDHKLPPGKVLIAGVIDSVTNFVEHPDLVADRIEKYASVVGRENVIAGTDCGFGTFARSHPRVHPTIAWAKLETLVEGARRATQRLW